MNQNETQTNASQELHISFAKADREVKAMNLIDGFLFNSVIENEEDAKIVARKILSRILQKELSDIEITSQKVFNGVDTKYHGIRMDVHIKESQEHKKLKATIYDIEVESRPSDRPDIPRRQRYYSAMIDTKALATSEDYRALPEYISITILSYDPFLLGDMYYEARMSLVSHPKSGYSYDDGIVNIFLYANGRVNTDDPEYGESLKRMLKYIVTGEKPKTPDTDIEALDIIVTRVKSNAEVTREYMKQWDREATLKREVALETKKQDALEIICFGREDGIPDDKIRFLLENRLKLSSDVIDVLFEKVDEPTGRG